MTPRAEKLRSYYNAKALSHDERRLTYESDIAYKRFFYGERFRNVMTALNPAPDDYILDVGCGCGYYARAMLQRDARVLATEYAENYLHQARRLVGPELAERASFAVEDAQRLSLPDGAVDKVLMTEVIEHLPEPDRALREARRVLRPDGLLVVTTPSRFSPMNVAYAAKRRVRRYATNEHLHEFSIRGFRALVSRYFELEHLTFANYLIPYPADGLALHASERGIMRLQRLEHVLARTPGVRRLGWTMIAAARRSDG